MAFPTLTFTYLVLPIFTIVSRLLGEKKAERWLLLCSALYLCAFNIWILISCVAFSAAAYLFVKKGFSYAEAIAVQVILFVVSRISIVFFYRSNLSSYMGVLVITVATIPLAVCTMNNISYIFEVKNRRCERADNFWNYLGYTLFLPVLFTGPFFTYEEFALAVRERNKSAALLWCGIKEYIIGLAKAVLLGAGAITLWSEVNALGAENIATGTAWIGLLGAAFGVYYVLTGYNDMCIGLASMFGVEMTRGYDHPLCAHGFIDFLKRFNIYVWNWSQKYVISESQINSHVMYSIIWLILTLFYGIESNMLIWGVLFGIFAAAEYYFLDLRKKNRRDIINLLYSIPCIFFGFIFFCYFDLDSVASYIKILFSFSGGSYASAQFVFLLLKYLCLIVACILFSMNVWRRPEVKLKKKTKTIITPFYVAFLALLMFVTTAYLIDTRANPFLLIGVWPL